jgi:hypothetical protein
MATRKPRSKKDDGQLIPFEVAEEKKQVEAHKLRMRGTPWAVIAEQVGYASAAVAIMETRRYISKLAIYVDHDQRQEALQLELARLDTMQESQWDAALGGDLQAFDRVLKVMVHRSKLLGLDTTADTKTTNTTIVVTGDTSQYVDRLKTVIGELDA